MTRALIVAGTDTGIGKTVAAAALVSRLDADYWKPIQAGLDGETDREVVIRLSGIDAARAHAEAYRLRTPASPHRAAELDGILIEPVRISPPSTRHPLVIELAGGLLVPVTRNLLQIDMVAPWSIPVVLVASTRLGTINHTLLSLEALRHRDLTVAGILFSGDANPDTEHTIASFANVPILGRLPHIDPCEGPALRTAARTHLDIAPITACWERTR